MSAADSVQLEGGELEGSKEARRHAVILLELLTGMRTGAEAAEALGCSPSRVYQLEARALQGVVRAMEPRPRGPRPDSQKQLAEIEREKQSLADELARTQALLRTAYRSFGMPASRATGKKDDSPVRRRRKKPLRARKAIARIAGDDGALADGKQPKPAKAKGKSG